MNIGLIIPGCLVEKEIMRRTKDGVKQDTLRGLVIHSSALHETAEVIYMDGSVKIEQQKILTRVR